MLLERLFLVSLSGSTLRDRSAGGGQYKKAISGLSKGADRLIQVKITSINWK